MNITFVLPGLTRQPVGGYKVVYQYANYFVNKGHHVTIAHVRYSPHDAKPSFISAGAYLAKKALLTFHLIAPWFKLDPRIKVLNYEHWEKVNLPAADVIIATAWDTVNIVRHQPKSSGRRFYFIQHLETWDNPEDVLATWRQPFKKIVIASWLQQYALKLNEKAEVVRNFVDPSTFYYDDELSLRHNVVAMLYSPYAIKGSDIGIEAIKRAHDSYPDLKAILFGSVARPEGLPEYISYIQGESGEGLRKHVYSKASVYLLPSKSEGWGLTATEAMSCGCALVSTANGGVNDFGIQDQTALISAVDDVDSLAKSIVTLMQNIPLRVKLARSGSELLKGFTLEHSANKFLYLLESEA